MKAYYDAKPSTLEAVGNGNYLYRWDIKEETAPGMESGEGERTQWTCREVTIHGEPSYGKCVEAVIRSDYSAEAELSLINQYYAYQTGVTSDASVVEEYEEYLAYVAGIKEMVKKDMEIAPTEPKAAFAPRMADLARLLTMQVNTMSLTDEEALSVKSVYPEWASFIGKNVKKDAKMQYGGKLWKVLQEHTVQEQWKPGEGTESLYAEINETHAGTLEDPIPYSGNMELESGKYYSQGGKVYHCTRDTEIPVYAGLAELVGIYVELANNP